LSKKTGFQPITAARWLDYKKKKKKKKMVGKLKEEMVMLLFWVGCVCSVPRGRVMWPFWTLLISHHRRKVLMIAV
jgi:hypothetical protein